MNKYQGPSTPLSQEIDEMKYRQEGEDFHDKVLRIATALKDSDEHFEAILPILGEMRFLPAGRIQSATIPQTCLLYTSPSPRDS